MPLYWRKNSNDRDVTRQSGTMPDQWRTKQSLRLSSKNSANIQGMHRYREWEGTRLPACLSLRLPYYYSSNSSSKPHAIYFLNNSSKALLWGSASQTLMSIRVTWWWFSGSRVGGPHSALFFLQATRGYQRCWSTDHIWVAKASNWKCQSKKYQWICNIINNKKKKVPVIHGFGCYFHTDKTDYGMWVHPNYKTTLVCKT